MYFLMFSQSNHSYELAVRRGHSYYATLHNDRNSRYFSENSDWSNRICNLMASNPIILHVHFYLCFMFLRALDGRCWTQKATKWKVAHWNLNGLATFRSKQYIVYCIHWNYKICNMTRSVLAKVVLLSCCSCC